MKNKNFYPQLIEAKAPLVFRTGKPTLTAMVPDCLPFPFPSTVAGALRSIYGEAHAFDYNDKSKIKTLLDIEIHGPLAAERDLQTQALTVLFPKPQDAVYLQENAQEQVFSLKPKPLSHLPAGSGCNLDNRLMPLVHACDSKNSPADGAIFWRAPVMMEWLLTETVTASFANIGIDGFPMEQRTHVAINNQTLTADSGLLFQSTGIDFGSKIQKSKKSKNWENKEIVLLANSSQPLHSKPILKRVGGESRLALVSEQPAHFWPPLEENLKQELQKSRYIRMILATPALFTKGYLPDWLDKDLIGSPPYYPNIRFQLHAVANARWQPISGWDLEKKKPWAARRMVPAGAVYWFEVLEGSEQLPELWLKPISCQEQDRKDGFGLVLLGLWHKN